MAVEAFVTPPPGRRLCDANEWPHPKHLWEEPEEIRLEATTKDRVLPDQQWFCDGQMPIGDFIELTLRVPLDGHLSTNGLPHDLVLNDIIDEGLGSFTWDERHNPSVRGALRLRVGSDDRCYVVEKGQVVR